MAVNPGSVKMGPVLLLRAQRQQDLLLDMLAGQGFPVTHIPLIKIKFLEQPAEVAAILESLRAFPSVDKVMVVSTNAAQAFSHYVNQMDSLHADTVFFAVGQSTKQRLAAIGYKALVPDREMTSEGLLKLKQLANVANENILLLTGLGGRALLETELQQRGARVMRCPLYVREPVAGKAESLASYFSGTAQPIILIHSAELLDGLLNQLPKDCFDQLLASRIVVPSRRIEALARDKGLSRIVVAVSALPEDMVSAVKGCYSKT